MDLDGEQKWNVLLSSELFRTNEKCLCEIIDIKNEKEFLNFFIQKKLFIMDLFSDI